LGDIIFNALLAIFAIATGLSAQDGLVPCRAPEIFHDDGAASGCQVQDSAGKTIRVGVWRWRNGQGQILREVSYDSAGREHGLTRVWGVPGRQADDIQKNLLQARRYFHGRWHGVTEFWTADGRPDGSRCFVCGERYKLGDCRFDTASEQEYAERCVQPAELERSLASRQKHGARAPAGVR
jgi:hypothetical protein